MFGTAAGQWTGANTFCGNLCVSGYSEFIILVRLHPLTCRTEGQWNRMQSENSGHFRMAGMLAGTGSGQSRNGLGIT